MKMKVLILAVLVSLASAAEKVRAGGPQVAVSIGNRGGWCPPVRPICRPVSFCPPVACRNYSTWYSWGPSVVVSSWGSGFSNISPVMNYSTGEPVYRVPAPVLPAQPVTVHPGSTFSWRR